MSGEYGGSATGCRPSHAIYYLTRSKDGHYYAESKDLCVSDFIFCPVFQKLPFKLCFTESLLVVEDLLSFPL